MDCVDVAGKLLEREFGHEPELDAHVAQCANCAQLSRGLARLDAVLTSVLVVQPPLELQQRLARLTVEAARPPRVQPWWQRILEQTRWLTERPQLVAAQGLAALLLVLASWQIFGWLSAVQPVVGNVGYAVELVAASPAVGYLANVQIDFQSLSLWSVVGILGWLVSENGLIGRRIASSGLRLP